MSTLKELAATYNEVAATLGEKHVTKFRDRATAERRVAELLARLEPKSGHSPAPPPALLSLSSRPPERVPSARGALGSCSSPRARPMPR